MIFPPGRYVVIESVEVSVEHTLVVSSKFYIAHSRALRLADGTKGALVCLLVSENAQVETWRRGRLEEIWKKGERDDSRIE